MQQYVTGETLDGLCLVTGGEEKKIRQTPSAHRQRDFEAGLLGR